jgi:hypothetical protein
MRGGPTQVTMTNFQGKTSIPLRGVTFECGEGVKVFNRLEKVGRVMLCLGGLSLTFISSFYILLTHYYNFTFLPCLDFSN